MLYLMTPRLEGLPVATLPLCAHFAYSVSCLGRGLAHGVLLVYHAFFAVLLGTALLLGHRYFVSNELGFILFYFVLFSTTCVDASQLRDYLFRCLP